jgi:hypothetical protein
MSGDGLSNNEIATLLIKEYDAMRTELREYIKRYYSSIVIVQSLIFATIFTAAKDDVTWLYLFIPPLIMGFAGLMSLVTLFISQQASYLKLIEKRLNNLCGKEYFIWETKYADQSLGRDRGLMFAPLISLIYVFLIIPIIPAFGFSVWKGFDYLKQNHQGWEIGFIIFSAVALISLVLFPITNKYVRSRCAKFNDELTAKP